MNLRSGILFALLTALFAVLPVRSGAMDLTEKALKSVHADGWSVVGKNIIAKGHVHISFGELEFIADQAILNLESRDLEAVGDIRVTRNVSATITVPLKELVNYQDLPDSQIEIVGLQNDLWGQKSISVKRTFIDGTISAERVSGNLDSGYFRFDKAQLRFKNFVCQAESGERRGNGVIEIKNAEISACSYLKDGNAHYSIGAEKAVVKPYEPNAYGLQNVEKHPGDYSVWVYNGLAKVYGIPVLWLPMFYKPKDENPGIAGVMFGKQTDWGYYVSFYKRFTFSDYPYASVKVRGDWYEKRGFGYGAIGEFGTEQSTTQFSVYSIYDTGRYRTDSYELYRLDVPYQRYNFNVNNITHITPRLDFRGNFDYSSDYYFRRDFLAGLYNADPRPATFMALEQQFDHFSAAVYFRFQVMKSYNTVEKIPEVRIDLHRQEIFDTNIYYQGDMSADYLRMKWIEFDEPPVNPLNELKDYDAFRFDTTHFLYYPIRLDWLTLVPRAGFKFTAYSDSSDTKIKEDDLMALFVASDAQSMGVAPLKNYDSKGGARARFLGELGMEASTKIHNTWQNARSSFLGLDGLRHVMRPYLNYTMIANPTVDPEHLYYFDDIDRINDQNFLRFGLENRLQTRSGNTLTDYFYMENYWDLHFIDDPNDHYDNIGALGTIIRTKPIKRFSISTELLADLGNNNELPDVYRHGRNVGQVGLGAKWIDRWRLTLSYSIIDDVTASFSYNYNRGATSRAAYSMGSTLTQIDSGGYFSTYSNTYSETFSISVSAPLTPDRRTMGAFTLAYDTVMGKISDIGFSIIRKFHCFDVMATLEFEYNDDYDSKKRGFETAFSIQARLTGLEAPVNDVQSSALSSAHSMMSRNDNNQKFW